MISLLYFLILFSANANVSEPSQLSLDDLVMCVSTRNYSTLEESLKVYQAKEEVQLARGNLLPRLNIWRVAGVVFTTGGAAMNAVNLAEDLVPFLIPANWFRATESELFYLSEQEAFRALWANEIMTAKALYFHSLLDQALLEQIKKNQNQLADLFSIIQTRELLGGVPPGTAKDVEIRELALSEDSRALQSLIQSEKAELLYAMGLPAAENVELNSITLPVIEDLKPLEYEDFEFRVTDISPEVLEFDHLIKAAAYVKKEIQYAFFGVTPMSRGSAGGVFDSIPYQPGLGFGTHASMNIAEGQTKILKLQRQGVSETALKQLKVLISNYNLDLDNYHSSMRRVQLAESIQSSLIDRMVLGQNVEIFDLIEASRNVIQAQTVSFAIQFRFLSHIDKLNRLLMNGDYRKLPVALELAGGIK